MQINSIKSSDTNTNKSSLLNKKSFSYSQNPQLKPMGCDQIAFKGVLDSGLQKILDATKAAKSEIDDWGWWKRNFVSNQSEAKKKLDEEEHQQLKGYALAQQEIVALLEQQSKTAEAKLAEAKKIVQIKKK